MRMTIITTFVAETVWDKPKQGYLTLDEYNNIMEQSRTVHEAHAQREKKFLVENADEMAAKYNREKLKQRRAEYEAKQKQQQREKEKEKDEGEKRVQQQNCEDEGESGEEESSHYPPPAPFGQWQTVGTKEVPYVDLQLPDQNRYHEPVAAVPVVDEPKPVKVFKEKVVTTLDKETTAADVGVFKKRKINITLKKNSRQRLEDY